MFEIITIALIGGVVYALAKTKKLPGTEEVERHQTIQWGDWSARAGIPNGEDNVSVESMRLGSNGLPFYVLVENGSNVHYAVRNLPPDMIFKQ